MSQVAPLRVLIMAGGTGGHVFPALAVAEELQARGAIIEWLGTAKGIESRVVPAACIPLNCIRVEGVRGRGVVGLLKAPFLILLAIIQACAILRKFKPNVVLGFGGFASGPGGVAARLTASPLVIHEQNAVAGTTNRLLAKIATKVLCAFPSAFKKETVKVDEVLGNPVRQSICAIAPIAQRYSERAKQNLPLQLLVLGGSLGAKAINELLPAALAELPVTARPVVWHQAGRTHADATAALYLQQKVEAKVDAFIDDMAAAYAWADVVICRAGALTISELTVAGVASVLIPLPTAIDDHQTWNAQFLVQANAGVAVVQAEFSAAKLAALLLTQLADRHQLQMMAEKAQQLAQMNAAVRVADVCVEVARG